MLSGELGCADVVDCPPRAEFVPFARLQLGQFWVEDEDEFAPQSASFNQTIVPGSTNPYPNSSRGVYIPFEDSQGLMFGYIDLIGEETGTGTLGGDGSADDIDNDFQYGPDGFDTEDPYGEVDNRPWSPPDFDDLVPLPLTSIPLAVEQVKLREEVRIENLEFSLQHLYDDGWVNSRPAWRIGANGWGMNLDVGQLPMPSSASAPSDPNAGCLAALAPRVEPRALRLLRRADSAVSG